MVMHYEHFAICVHFTSKQTSQAWTLVNIYGPCDGELRYYFVKWLYELNILDDEDWLLIGYFNFIISPSNKNKHGVILLI
jgi:hypothetical protein